MKKLFLLFIITSILFSCQHQKDTCQLKGNIQGLTGGQVYLKREVNERWAITDSALIDQKGNFVFSGKVVHPEFVVLVINDTLSLRLFLEPGRITVKASVTNFRNATVEGSSASTEYKNYQETLARLFQNREDSLYALYRQARESNDSKLLASVIESFDQLEKETGLFKRDYVRQHPGSPIAPYIVWRELSYAMEPDELESFVSLFDTTNGASIYVRSIRSRIETLRRVAIGKPAPDFTLITPDGKPVSLSSMLGGYLLVDFWASWCGPCRRENPNVVKAYKEFHQKGFNVLGVSLDKDSASWVKAIKDDKLEWTHVSDLKYWDCAPARLYGVRSIPANFLISPEGTILAKNLTGEKLQEKLSELLK